METNRTVFTYFFFFAAGKASISRYFFFFVKIKWKRWSTNLLVQGFFSVEGIFSRALLCTTSELFHFFINPKDVSAETRRRDADRYPRGDAPLGCASNRNDYRQKRR